MADEHVEDRPCPGHGCHACRALDVQVDERTFMPRAQAERIMDTWAGRGSSVEARTGVRLLA